MSILTLIFGVISLWWTGGSLERSWGSLRFALFFVGVTLLDALLVWVGSWVLHGGGFLLGIWPPVAAITAAWASINPDQEVVFNFVIKMRSRWMALLFVLITYFMDFHGQPLIGLFWLLCPIAAWYYVRKGYSIGRPIFNRRPPSRGPDLRFSTSRPRSESSTRGKNPLAWYRNWQEKRHLEKLWRNSGLSDKDDRKQR